MVGFIFLSSVVHLFFGYCSLAIFIIISSTYDLFVFVPAELLPLVSFLVEEYILKYGRYFDSHLSASVPIDWQNRFVCDSLFGVNQFTTAGACTKIWAHLGYRGVALRIDSVVISLNMRFMHCFEEVLFVSRLVAVIVHYADLRDENFTTHSLNCVAAYI